MIKYVVLPEKNTVYGIMSNTRYDAMHKINKMLNSNVTGFGVCDDKYLMPNMFKARVVCHPNDQFDEEKGRELAKQKVLRNYYHSLDKRMDAFKSALIEINSKAFETDLDLLNDIV